MRARPHHLSLVLRRLAEYGPRSRAELARDLGLTKATASSLVADLLERDLVEERATLATGAAGRPGTDVALSGSRLAGLGLEIDADHVAAAVVDLTGAVRSRVRHECENRSAPGRRVLERLHAAATEALGGLDGLDVVGAALAVPGLVEPGTHRLHVAPNLHWFDADLDRVGTDLGLRLVVDNEANLAAMAEHRFGAGRGRRSFVYLSGGIGVGAGIVVDGELARGAHGFGGEIGHLVVDPTGKRCACGSRGCLETIAGRDRRASRKAVADAVSTALRSVVHLLDPDAIILGGTFVASGDALARTVADQLAATTLGARWHRCEVVPSQLGDEAAVIGAAAVALDPIIADPELVPVRPSEATA